MNVNGALKKKNRLAKEITEKQQLLTTQNVYKAKNADKLQYNTKDILSDLYRVIDNLVETKSAIARANHEVYPKIFRMAELKGLVTILKMVPVKSGIETEVFGYRGDAQEVDWKSTLEHKEIDDAVAKLEFEIQSLQDDLDKFNFTTDLEI
jgi:hypothetical protein